MTERELEQSLQDALTRSDFDTFLNQVERWVHRRAIAQARKRGLQPADCDDVAQEAMSAVLFSLNTIHDWVVQREAPLFAYLERLFINKINDHFRSRRKLENLESIDIPDERQRSAEVKALELEAARQECQELLKRLRRPKDRTLVKLWAMTKGVDVELTNEEASCRPLRESGARAGGIMEELRKRRAFNPTFAPTSDWMANVLGCSDGGPALRKAMNRAVEELSLIRRDAQS